MKLAESVISKLESESPSVDHLRKELSDLRNKLKANREALAKDGTSPARKKSLVSQGEELSKRILHLTDQIHYMMDDK